MKLALLSPMLHDLDYLSGQPEVGEERFLALISVHYNLIPDDTRINHLVQDDSSFRIQDVEQEQRCLDEMEFDDMLLFSVENIEEHLMLPPSKNLEATHIMHHQPPTYRWSSYSSDHSQNTLLSLSLFLCEIKLTSSPRRNASQIYVLGGDDATQIPKTLHYRKYLFM